VVDVIDLLVMFYDIFGCIVIKIVVDILVCVVEYEWIVVVKDVVGDVFEGVWVMVCSDLVYYFGDDVVNLFWLVYGVLGLVSVVGYVVGL